MSRKYIERTGTFTAQSKDGREFTVHIFTDYHETHASDGTQRVEGLKSLETSDGDHVNRIDKG